jgi:hypothetical protein
MESKRDGEKTKKKTRNKKKEEEEESWLDLLRSAAFWVAFSLSLPLSLCLGVQSFRFRLLLSCCCVVESWLRERATRRPTATHETLPVGIKKTHTAPSLSDSRKRVLMRALSLSV